jgi:PAS domain S-box-containing protein
LPGLLDGLPTLFWTFDPASGKLVHLSASFDRILGGNREAACGGVRWHDRIHPEDRSTVDAGWKGLVSGTPLEVIYRVRRQDGSWVWLRDRGWPATHGAGALLVGLAEDVTFGREAEARRFHFEERMAQVQKMESLGTLASGVAHDFNNVLTAILGFCDMAGRDREEDERLAENLDGIRKAAVQATSVTRALLTFSRRSRTALVPLDLGRVVSGASLLIRRMLPAQIRLETDLGPDAPLHALADETLLLQVLVNLAINAREAMPAGGNLALRLRSTSVEGEDGVAETWGRMIVEDDGEGISPEVRSRVFEPFFTTKSRERGTGLGLSVVHGIVTDHGGRIELEAREGGGTRVNIDLPLCPHPETAREVVPGTGQRILLAEDDRQVRAILSEMLVTAGFKVTTAADGDKALDAFRAGSEFPDLVILDVDLPRTSGGACLQAIRKISPSLPVVMISGVEEGSLPEELRNVPYLLEKPFQMRELVEIVQKALSERG